MHLQDGLRTFIFKFKLANGLEGIHRQDARSHFSAFSIVWNMLAKQYGLSQVTSLLCVNLQDDIGQVK